MLEKPIVNMAEAHYKERDITHSNSTSTYDTSQITHYNTQMARVTQSNTHRTHDISKIYEHIQNIQTITRYKQDYRNTKRDNRRWTWGQYSHSPFDLRRACQ